MELETVKEEIRDSVMKNILSIPSNQSCFDCGNKQPRWSSPYLGIVICMECAGRHRSYGTHISFVKSVDLDKWNKKQLKSLELTGNFYMKKQFDKFKIPKIEKIYDYNNELIFKIREHIENLVKEYLKPDDYSSIEQIEKNENEYYNIQKMDVRNINNNLYNKNNNDNKEFLKPVKFNTKKNEPKRKKENRKNNIKKLDIDFDFNNFDAYNNKNNEKTENSSIDPTKIKGMKLSRIDKKKALIEQKNKDKNKSESNRKISICEKFKNCLYYIFGLCKK